MFNRSKTYFVTFTARRLSDDERVFGNCTSVATPLKSIEHIHALEVMIEMNDPDIHSVRILDWKRFE